MTVSAANGSEQKVLLEVSVGLVLWIVAAAAFVLLRLAFLMRAPVGGFELLDLAGSWQAHVGQSDSRFIPTAFQAIVSLFFGATDSEMPARTLALISTATVPLALYALRPQLGDAGALIALVLLALDGPGIALGGSASASGFDLAVALWLLVMLTRRELVSSFVAAIAGLVVATSGPLVLPLVGAVIAVPLVQGKRLPLIPSAYAIGGAIVGILLASLRFGLGWDGLTIPVFESLSRGFSAAGSTATTGQLAVVYSLPVLAAGLCAGALLAHRAYRERDIAPFKVIVLAWGLVAFGWFVASLGSHDPVALAATTTPAAILAAIVLPEAVAAIRQADWTQARWLVPAALVAAALAGAFVIQWARLGHTGDANEKVLVAGFVVLAFSCLGYVAASRDALPTLLVVAMAVAIIPLTAAGFGVTFGSQHELLPSPVSPDQARQLRAIVLEQPAPSAGRKIVVYPSLERDITWPFRDSGKLVVASRVPEDATVAVWPAGSPAPDGFSALAGEWSLERLPSAPSLDFLKFVRWFTDRNSLAVSDVPVAVYIKVTQ